MKMILIIYATGNVFFETLLDVSKLFYDNEELCKLNQWIKSNEHKRMLFGQCLEGNYPRLESLSPSRGSREFRELKVLFK